MHGRPMRAGSRLRLALATLLTSPLALAAQQADTAELVLVDLRIENAASATVQAYRYRDQALIPLGQFLTLAEVQHTLAPGGRVEGVLQPAGLAFVIDPASDTAIIGDRRHALRRFERLVRDDETYIDAEQLGPMFGVAVTVDWSDLLVTVGNAGSLPVSLRQRRRHARTVAIAQNRQTQAIIEGVPLGMLRPKIDGAVLDYSVTMPSSDPSCGTSGALAFGANVLGGSLEMVRTSSGGKGADGKCLRTGDGQLSWTGVWLDNKWLKQLRIGEGTSGGVSPRQIRGALITNSPYIREPMFGTGRYIGYVGQAWEVEAYRSGGLVAVDTADSTGRFDLVFPITYGDNPVYFFAYGPYGEERRFDKSYRVVYDLVPRRTFEYGLSGGVCPVRILCRNTGNLDLRYGITEAWTARAGMDYFNRDSLPNLSHPYTRLTGVITNAISVDLRATYRALLGAEVAFQPSVNRRVALSHTLFDATVVAPIITSSGARRQTLFSGFYRPGDEYTPHFLQWTAEATERVTSRFYSLQIMPSTQSAQVRYMPRLRFERVTPFTGEITNRAIVGLNTFILFPPRWGRFWGRFAASTNADAELGRRFRYSQVGGSLITRLRGNEMVLVSSMTKTPTVPVLFSFSLQTNRAAIRGLTQAVMQRRTQTSVLQTVQGSVVFNRHTSATTLVAGPSLQRSGVTGRVYLDANANGLFDADDQPLSNVFVRAASGGSSTDSLGRFAIWDIPTFTRALVAVDSGSLESPLWIPSVAAHTIVPGPNHFRPLDLAVLPGGSIEGTVVRASGDLKLGLPGVRVLLANVQGPERIEVSTFADGGFAFPGVRPGTWELSVDEQTVARFSGAFKPETVVVQPLLDGAAISGVELAILVAPPPLPVVIDVPVIPTDSDGDGVLDPSDRCPNTPAGVRVDVAGCPILFGVAERTLTLRGVTFQTGSAVLAPASLATLDSVAASLLAIPEVRVEVGGHTDNVGTATLNLRLSLARARAVMNYLAERGVPLSRMSAVGYGPRLPVAPNTTAAGRAQNRRVELRRLD